MQIRNIHSTDLAVAAGLWKGAVPALAGRIEQAAFPGIRVRKPKAEAWGATITYA